MSIYDNLFELFKDNNNGEKEEQPSPDTGDTMSKKADKKKEKKADKKADTPKADTGYIAKANHYSHEALGTVGRPVVFGAMGAGTMYAVGVKTGNTDLHSKAALGGSAIVGAVAGEVILRTLGDRTALVAKQGYEAVKELEKSDACTSAELLAAGMDSTDVSAFLAGFSLEDEDDADDSDGGGGEVDKDDADEEAA